MALRYRVLMLGVPGPRTSMIIRMIYSVSQKIPPRGPDIFSFFHKQLRIFNLFFYTSRPIIRSYLR